MIGEFLSGEAGQYRHIHRESVGSTNVDLIELAMQGDPGNLWLTADEQLAGKGSRGRDWVSKTGNMYASLLLLDPSPLPQLHQLTFVASVAARNALQKASLGQLSFEVKWPNDILCNQKKCAGILLESGQLRKVPYVVIGMGIDVSHYPDGTMHKATSLKDEGLDVSPKEVFAFVAQEVALAIQLWSRGDGFSAIMNSWRHHAFGIGQPISVKLPSGDVRKGRFASIDDEGYMLLQREAGEAEKISTADVFFT
ncbi:MAG: biotin--[acetyl-CoA-carboxylase] ligase [Rhizobiaceae bacterium]|nr:biotin--[acetyl-CoA-carboxylase] ligase [Rhizobiaceae bacterium]